MSKFQIHECIFKGEGVRIEFSKSYFHEKATWQLIISKQATLADLENNHHLDAVGDEIWSTVVEINNCPFCGIKLRNEQLEQINFYHMDSSGWSVDIS